MKVKWTEEQEKAVYGSKANCLVSAAAGSGKTQVLTGRILHRIIDENVDVHRMLVVTFTNAAAAEMRERITKSLSEALEENPESTRLKRQMTLLDAASITTMHAFCLQLLRTHFTEAGVDAGFRVADAAEAKLLQTEAVELALEKLLAEGDAEFMDFAQAYSSLKSDEALCDAAKELYSFAESMPAPMEWMQEKARLYDVEKESFTESIFAKTLLDSVRTALSGLAQMCKRGAEEHGESPAFAKLFHEDEQMLLTLCAIEDWDTLGEALVDIRWTRRSGGKEYARFAEADGLRATIKKQTGEMVKRLALSSEEACAVMRKAGKHVRALCRLTEEYVRVYSDMKKEKNLLDYNDLEHKAIALLTEADHTPSAIALALREKYDEIYIDEYQDSNEVQELLYSIISREGQGEPNRFMVGDMKQSIYGFRKTSPALFIQKCNTYQTEGAYRRIVLSKNFRSRPELLAFVNTVFEKLMTTSVGGIAYTKEERLYPGTPFPLADKPSVVFSIVDTEENRPERMEMEAYQIARIIRETVGTPIYDGKMGAVRPAQYGDIAVIMRSVKNFVTPLSNACAAMNIPLFCDIGSGYFASTEISTCLSLLKVIDNPLNDIPLLATMRAPFFAFTEEELAQIRLRDRKHLFYRAVQETAKENTPLGEKCKAFLQKLRHLRALSFSMPTDTLILRVFEETGYLMYVSGSEGGEKKRANMELLFHKAHQFEKTSFHGLFHFLRFIENMQTHSEDAGEASMVNENDNVVRLMTIHKSKGLEFPIVILADLAKDLDGRKGQEKFLFHKDIGIGVHYVDTKEKIRYKTPGYAAIAEAKKEEEIGEELRVLYVALTRAKERLFLVGATDMKKQMEAWKGSLSPFDVLHGGSFLTLLGRCALLAGSPIAGVQLDVCVPFQAMEEPEKTQKQMESLPPDAKTRAILEYQYPHKTLRAIPSKVSVTEYKRMIETQDEASLHLYRHSSLKKPRFLQMEGNIRGATFGTLMHFIMQSIPLQRTDSEKEISLYVAELAERKILSSEQANAVHTGKIHAFFQSPIGQRMKKADRVYREEPFTMMVPASKITGEKREQDEKIVIQGIIDCYFFEGKRLVLLDYKTDALWDEKTILQRYKTQMDCYAMALRQKYFSEIYEKVIYLFSNNGIIVVP